jgi:hypothetical protein
MQSGRELGNSVVSYDQLYNWARPNKKNLKSTSGRDAWCVACGEAAVVALDPYAFILSCNYIYIMYNLQQYRKRTFISNLTSITKKSQ